MVMVDAEEFDKRGSPAYFPTMEKPKRSMYDIGVYLYFILVVVGLFAAFWLASDFFTAIVALQFIGPIIILLSVGPSMFFGEVFDAVAGMCKGLFKSTSPPGSSASGQPVHTTT